MVAAGVVGLRHLAALLRPAGLVVAFGGGALVLGFLGLLLGRLALHGLGLGAEHGLLVLRLGLALAGLVLLAGILAALLAVVLVLGLGFHLGLGQVERGQQLAGGAGEGVLVVGGGGHLGQGVVGAVAEAVAPEVQHALGRGRGRLAGDAFAGQQGQRRGQRQLVLPGHPVVALGLAHVGQPGAKVGGRRRTCASSRRPRPARPRARRRPPSPPAAAAGARHGRLRSGGGCGGRRHRRRRAAWPSRPRAGRGSAAAAAPACRRRRRAGLEGDLHLGIGMRDGAQRAGRGALELFLTGQVLLAHGSA